MRRPLYLVVLVLASSSLASPALAQTAGLDCSHFATSEAPQAVIAANPSDPNGLDPNGNGAACEVLADGTLEDGSVGTQLPDSGGPVYVIPSAIALLLVSGLAAAFAWRRMRQEPAAGRGAALGLASGSRMVLLVLAAAAAAALAASLILGQERSASAQSGSGALELSKNVYPSRAATSGIPVGERMDFLITEYNNSPFRRTGVVIRDDLPAGAQYEQAHASQGSCSPMADAPTIYCQIGTIEPYSVVHVNIVAVASKRGTYSNVAYDNRNHTTYATFKATAAFAGN